MCQLIEKKKEKIKHIGVQYEVECKWKHKEDYNTLQVIAVDGNEI